MTTGLPDGQLPVTFHGRKAPLFWLAIKTGFFTVLTLGIYRFWMKSRMRRWYWSSIRPGGQPLEYTGDPFEKLLGFLIAVVFLAFYLGIVNLILMFVSFSLLAAPGAAYAVSLVGVIPLWFYARYRSRRYVLARTRWRGLRFGLLPGAWGYALRAFWHWFVTLISLGVLWPRMTFHLEKYITDRTQFGSVTLQQGGSWTMLYPATVHVAIGVIFSVLALLIAGAGTPGMAGLLFLTIPWAVYGVVHYRVVSKRLMANEKTAGTLGLISVARPARVFAIRLIGTTGTALVVMMPVFALILALTVTEGLFEAMDGNAEFQIQDAFAVLFQGLPRWLTTAFAIAFYFFIFLMWAVLNHVWVTMPIWRHYATTLTVTGAQGLHVVQQREKDTFAEAEGFAEALDVGAAI